MVKFGDSLRIPEDPMGFQSHVWLSNSAYDARTYLRVVGKRSAVRRAQLTSVADLIGVRVVRGLPLLPLHMMSERSSMLHEFLRSTSVYHPQ